MIVRKIHKMNPKDPRDQVRIDRRNYAAISMNLHCKGGKMRDRRDRRPKDARRIKEQFEEG